MIGSPPHIGGVRPFFICGTEMNRTKLPDPNGGWRTFWTYPDNGCEHEYDEDAELLDETEHGGAFICLNCQQKLSFDFADSGD